MSFWRGHRYTTRAAAFFSTADDIDSRAAGRCRIAPSGCAGNARPAALSNPDFMGMVIRDPWYDFGTNPAFPDQPNQAFQDTMGATLARMGVRWVRLDFHIVVPLADVTVDQTAGDRRGDRQERLLHQRGCAATQLESPGAAQLRSAAGHRRALCSTRPVTETSHIWWRREQIYARLAHARAARSPIATATRSRPTRC